MTPQTTNKENIKNFSAPKAILAALRDFKECSRERLLTHSYIQKLCAHKNKATIRSSMFRLLKDGHVRKDFNDILVLTDKGKEESLFSYIDAESFLYKLETQKWDGGWRIIFFDIPEDKRRYRDYLRKVLKKIGFREFQKSIWAYPFPVPSFLKELILNKNIKGHVKFITASDVYNDSDLRKIFKLR